jgi:hypothetical protein
MNITVKEAQEQIAELLMSGSYLEELLMDQIDRYLDSDVVYPGDIEVTLSTKTFLFKEAKVVMFGRHMSSREEDSADYKRTCIVGGNGKFEYSENKIIKIYDLKRDFVNAGEEEITRY